MVTVSLVTGPRETPASVHPQLEPGTVLSAGPGTHHPEVPVLPAGDQLQLTGVPAEEDCLVMVGRCLVRTSPVRLPIRATDLRERGSRAVSAPLSIAREPLAQHRQPGSAGLEDRLAGGLREGPADWPRGLSVV